MNLGDLLETLHCLVLGLPNGMKAYLGRGPIFMAKNPLNRPQIYIGIIQDSPQII